MTTHLQSTATGTKTALAVVRNEFAEGPPDVEKALTLIECLVVEAEAGRNPLLLPDTWSNRLLWPDRPHWDCWAWAIKTLAQASGAKANCDQKCGRMRVDVSKARNNSLTMALAEIGDLIEEATDSQGLTVSELIAHLRQYPADLPVLVEGYEADLDSIHELRLTGVVPLLNASEFKQAGKQAVLIVGRRGDRR